MKSTSWLASLLGALVCVDIAHSMMCFTCEKQVSNWNCLKVTSCREGANKCLTIGSLNGTGSNTELLITKMCAPHCPELADNPNRASSSLYCCDCSLCNIWRPK